MLRVRRHSSKNVETRITPLRVAKSCPGTLWRHQMHRRQCCVCKPLTYVWRETCPKPLRFSKIFRKQEPTVCTCQHNTYNACLQKNTVIYTVLGPLCAASARKNVKTPNIAFVKSRSRYSVVQILLLATAWRTRCAFYHVIYTFFCSCPSFTLVVRFLPFLKHHFFKAPFTP